MLSQRRQNSSCDPCRRSKRRCFFSSPRIGDTDVACTHCERLGHTCTFEFVGSQSQKKRPRRARTRQNTSDSAAEVSSGLASGDFKADAVAGHDVLASWLDFDYLEQNNECLELPDFLAPDAATAIETSKEDRLRVRPNLQHFVGSSLNSPIRLLNSKLDATILDIRLARIHDTIVTGCASRFADYDCNLYATASRYRLGDGDSEHHLLSSNASPQSQALTSQTDISFGPGLAPRDPGCMMTVLGTVRFLDHFSDLYGNRLTTVARRQSDAALKAVLRLFSLQWLSTAEPTSTSADDPFANNPDGNQRACNPLENVFHGTWFQARTLLRNAQSVRSFRVVYATLFFDGIAIPTKAHGATESIVAHEFLDAGLQKLISLDTLVNQYCATLGSHSVYGALLEASLSVVRWGGYIRDIGAALTTDHHCKLPGISSHAKGMSDCPLRREIPTKNNLDQVESYDPFQFDNRNFHADLNNSVSSICQKAVAEAFCVWRQIVEVKGSVSRHVQSHSRIPLELSETIASTMTAVAKFNQSFRPFMSTCIDNLERLSIRSRTSAGMLYSTRI